MRLYEKEIVNHLNSKCAGESIHFVGLGAHDFQIAFGNIKRIQSFEMVEFNFSNTFYTWKEGPSSIPVWLLVNQVPTLFKLYSHKRLRMCLASNDYVDFITTEGPYESTLIDFGIRDNKHVLEVF